MLTLWLAGHLLGLTMRCPEGHVFFVEQLVELEESKA